MREVINSLLNGSASQSLVGLDLDRLPSTGSIFIFVCGDVAIFSTLPRLNLPVAELLVEFSVTDDYLNDAPQSVFPLPQVLTDRLRNDFEEDS